ncbi:unnamed protein product, partial [Urochloa humidicola]
MEVGTLYPTMDELKLAVRQFAINNEFNLGVDKSCKTLYRAYCKSGDEDCPCPWRINCRKHKNQPTVEVTVLVDKHTCVSSMRQITTTPSCKWVASKAVSILREDPHIGARELQKMLERDHKCQIAYDTVWRGKERALDEVYGKWSESFEL